MDSIEQQKTTDNVEQKKKSTTASNKKSKPSSKSVDSQVQHTNDDSVVSKRSAGRMGYMHDDYLRYFVKKVSRRSPLINRGYYLRIHAMTQLVQRSLVKLLQFREKENVTSQAAVQVISLGAGFDTLAARLYSHADLQSVEWYEVDFPEVIKNKVQLMEQAPLTEFPFKDATVVHSGGELIAERYAAIGLDLRLTKQELIKRLSDVSQKRSGHSSAPFSVDVPTIVYAECVMQYMTPECSDSIVEWVAETFKHAVFFSYDQLNARDSFGKTMTQALKSKCSPLLGISDFPDGLRLSQRAARCHMPYIRFANFYNVSQCFFDHEELQRIDALESFDEVEEWHEMCHHYGILCGATDIRLGHLVADSFAIENGEHARRTPLFEDLLQAPAAAAAATVSTHLDNNNNETLIAWPTGRCAIEGWGFGTVAAIPLGDDETLFVSFGGFLTSKGVSRAADVLAHSTLVGDIPTSCTSTSPQPPAMVFHSFTQISKWQFVVFGGRTNPAEAFQKMYVLTLDASLLPERLTYSWAEVVVPRKEGDAHCPRPRYRHLMLNMSAECASALPAAVSLVRLFLHGGRSDDGTTLSDSWLCVLSLAGSQSGDGIVPDCAATARWFPLAAANTLPPLFSAAGVVVDKDTLLVSGGGMTLHEASSDLFVVRLEDASEVQRMEVTRSAVTLSAPRYSHAMLLVVAAAPSPKMVAFHGGSCTTSVGSHRLSEAVELVPLSLCLEPLATGQRATLADVAVERIPVHHNDPLHDATWTRHTVTFIQMPDGRHGLALIGGGFTCFSFGTFTAKPIIVALGMEHQRACQVHTGGSALDERAIRGAPGNTVAPLPELICTSYSDALFDRVIHNTMATLPIAEQVHHPVHLRGIQLGPCLEWTGESLRCSGDNDKIISIHVGNSPNPNFDFVLKNFSFRHVRLDEMIDHCFPRNPAEAAMTTKAFWYFRSVGKNMKTDRSDFWADFPHLAKDVHLPNSEGWATIMQRLHQACFRINQEGMQLWTHYDSNDNVLLQLVGVKRVVLFPPSQYTNLYMKGSSSRVTNIDRPDLHRFPRFAEALKRAHVVTLHPGDALVIPANWFHHITAQTSCVGLNLFYQRPGMGEGLFDPKDLYGNKDLVPCTEFTERTVSDVMSSLQHLVDANRVPKDYAAFTLRQLIHELEASADKWESTLQ